MLGHQTYSNSILQKPNIIWSWSAHEWELCIKLSHVFGDWNGDTLHLVSGCEWLLYIYTKALADRILSSVQRSKNLRVKPGSPVGIFYLFKMSSKKLISRIYIYIRNRWYFELIIYGNISLNYSICWIRVYIYMVFCIFNGIFYSMKNEYQQNQQLHINIFIKEGIITGIIGLLEYSICWFHVYIYRFSAPSMDYWLLYPTKNELLTFQLMNLGDLVELHILSMKPHKNCFIKKWISLEYSICWFHVYI